MVEIRVITYKRPRLLERALRSLQSQTYSHWRAVVYDDSRDFESREVVQALGDPRITVRQNPRNLGMIANLSQAFAAAPVFPEATHACILEDDNAFDPAWLEQNLVEMAAHPCRVMCRNYRSVDIHPDGSFQPTSHEPMRELYGSVSRYLPFEERVKEAFFTYTIGTCCYFWQLDAQVDLSADCEKSNGPLIEPVRAISFRDPCWYAVEPLSDFSRFIDKTQTPRGETPASTRKRRAAKVSEVLFTRRLLDLWRKDCGRPVAEIVELAVSRADGLDALERLASAGSLPALMSLAAKTRRSRLLPVAKTWCVAALYRRAWASAGNRVVEPV